MIKLLCATEENNLRHLMLTIYRLKDTKFSTNQKENLEARKAIFPCDVDDELDVCIIAVGSDFILHTPT
jgi:hypothetical protein